MVKNQFIGINEAWIGALNDLAIYGHRVESRLGNTKEIMGYSFEILDPMKCFLRNQRRSISPGYAAAELLWYLCRRDEVDWLIPYAPSYSNYANNGIAIGAYGKRWASGQSDQFANVFRQLQKSSNSRQAVIIHWNSSDGSLALEGKTKDLPCTLSLQFLVRDGKLNMCTSMRSNDVWMGMPYDVFCFCSLQMILASSLGLGLGSYYHSVASFHIYEKHWNAALECLAGSRDFLSPFPAYGIFPSNEISTKLLLADSNYLMDISLAKKNVEKMHVYNQLDVEYVLDQYGSLGSWMTCLGLAMAGKLTRNPSFYQRNQRQDFSGFF